MNNKLRLVSGWVMLWVLLLSVLGTTSFAYTAPANMTLMSADQPITQYTCDLDAVNINSTKGTFEINISNLSDGLLFQNLICSVWHEENKSDVKEYTATQSDNLWTVKANVKNHKHHFGSYIVQCYATTEDNTHILLKATTLNITAHNYMYTKVINNRQVRVAVKGVQGSDISFKTWSKKNGQDDIVTYPGIKTDDEWYVKTNGRKHKNTGTYITQIYNKDTLLGTVPSYKVKSIAYKRNIWIGDSRFVGMQQSIPKANTDTFISKGAMFWSWFIDTAVPHLKSILNSTPKRNVIINMGLNDVANYYAGAVSNHAKSYADAINSLITDYPNTKFYFVSVNPMNGRYPTAYKRKLTKKLMNKGINSFNSEVKKLCHANYITCNKYLKSVKYSTIDGIHFTQSTNEQIYNYCKSML